jgi:hypothetical protein
MIVFMTARSVGRVALRRFSSSFLEEKKIGEEDDVRAE